MFYQFKQTQIIPASLDDVWDFVSNPNNLKEITPEYLNFQLSSNPSDSKIMYAGMILTYKVKPLLGIPIDWMTEITQVKEKEYFVDEQRVGPYKMWHHQHKLEAIENGVIMTDIITYIPPFSFIGSIANGLFIKKQLLNIFNFRKLAIEKRFGIYQSE